MDIAEEIRQNSTELPPEQQQEVLDFVLFLRQRHPRIESPSASGHRPQRIRDALQNLARMNTFSEITDPLEWQREIRRDRPLPGRDD
ncbi:DUF2281 domain-containing protein [Endothiovibrio diazotrophicus]